MIGEKTAQALGLTIPLSLLSQADEINRYILPPLPCPRYSLILYMFDFVDDSC